MVGLVLGVGLFCGILFYVDGLSTSMTQRAVAPLPIDMQRIVTERIGGALTVTQTFESPGPIAVGESGRVDLRIENTSEFPANEVTVRSLPADALDYVPDSATLAGAAITGFDDNPFAHGPGTTGLNIGTVEPGAAVRIAYLVRASIATDLSDSSIRTTHSSRESVSPVAANQFAAVALDDLAQQIDQLDGVLHAGQLSFADLGPDALSVTSAMSTVVADGQAKIFGFDVDYADRDPAVHLVDGALSPDGAVISAEAARAMRAAIGDTVTIAMPDGSTLDLPVTGIADLTRSRSLFSSRRGGDLETFIYTPASVIVSPTTFVDAVLPAFERAATSRGARLKSPPVREIDITLDREMLDSDPATALATTQRIATDVQAVAAHQDFLLDNISNTLTVASADATVAKRLFVFLGLPGCLLAALLAAYAGSVLAAAQRREQAVLRIRGASRTHLLRMLTLRTAALTAVGSVGGLVVGYAAAAAVLGAESLGRANASSLVTSAVVGTVSGFLATGTALYVAGRRSIDAEINDDRAQFAERTPLWRRLGLDIVGVIVVVIGTAVAVSGNAFDGAAGSVYFGRAVQLNLPLLVLPVSVWLAGSLLGARLFGAVLGRSQPRSSNTVGSVLPSLYRFSVGRRPWAISSGALIVSLIVALATSLAAFTASYASAKAEDARYANGADIRITPGPASRATYGATDTDLFHTSGVAGVTPVIYAVSNVILRSARTSDPVNLAAIDPVTYAAVAPVTDADFPDGNAAAALRTLETDPAAVLVSTDMAAFLKAKPGDTVYALLVRATDQQVEVALHITGLFERLPGFPDGADAVMSIQRHTEAVSSKAPDFFLASTDTATDTGLRSAVASLEHGPGAADPLAIDTRTTTLARDQSSLAALNIAGLVNLDSTFALAMAMVTVAIFVFGLLLQRRREYIILRAQGLEPGTIRLLIGAEAATVAVGGTSAGLIVGGVMGYYFVTVLRPLFVLDPGYTLPVADALVPVLLVAVATVIAAVAGSRLVNRLDPTELLRDD